MTGAIMAAGRIDAVREAARARLGARAHEAPLPEPERLAALRREIREGAYTVPSTLVAEALLHVIGADRSRRRD
jgi:anti-sigma28 factor (negative regulator of flagellin synthesis)